MGGQTAGGIRLILPFLLYFLVPNAFGKKVEKREHSTLKETILYYDSQKNAVKL
ncbi:hypothetical protein NIASO_09710 [Niabella soli DSM 19437]|uniref:Uncharacterized protein n=1 Tax=Niabella soli DSM 19437 TaxID=929713 RepID=W0F851_9BACT|nr:hypothetical protein NIASO_09710 [Niabella soli DSM 19437]